MSDLFLSLNFIIVVVIVNLLLVIVENRTGAFALAEVQA